MTHGSYMPVGMLRAGDMIRDEMSDGFLVVLLAYYVRDGKGRNPMMWHFVWSSRDLTVVNTLLPDNVLLIAKHEDVIG